MIPEIEKKFILHKSYAILGMVYSQKYSRPNFLDCQLFIHNAVLFIPIFRGIER